MESSKNMFVSGLQDAFTKQPNVELNRDTMLDAVNYMQSMSEEDEDGETSEATGTGSSGGYSAPLFSGEEPKKVEAKEATTSGSVGAYETPAAWAKSTKKKDWGGKRKPQIPGGAFVSVKEKCKKFPYCNKGDINALNIYKNESVSVAIKNVSEKMNISETIIKAIIQHEMEKLNKRGK